MRIIKLIVIATIMTLPMMSGVMAQSDDKEVKLSEEEQAQLDYNWYLAHRLADYDRYSWIGTDSVLYYKDSFDVSLIRGWIVVQNEDACEVIFGVLDDTCLISPVQVPFVSKSPQRPSFETKCYDTTTLAYKGFWAMDNMRTAHQTEFDSAGVAYNSYVLFDGDTITVYFCPGSTDDYIAFCGSYRGKYLKTDLKPFADTKLHETVVIFEPHPDAVGMVRTSLERDLLNEVDLAQFLIEKWRVPRQHIITEKYIFVLDKDAYEAGAGVTILLSD